MLLAMKIENAKTLITGASRGIGRALALTLAERGAQVLGCARDSKRLAQLEKDSQGRVAVITADLARPEEASRVVEAAASGLGGLDLVVNNAGIINQPGPVAEIPIEEWRTVMDVNVIGLVAVLRAALPHLEQSSGCAVNLSSYWGRHGAARFGPYCASKFAVEGLSQSAAEESQRATIVALSPGIVDTDMLNIAFDGDTAGNASPEDCAERFVSFLVDLDRRSNGKPCEL